MNDAFAVVYADYGNPFLNDLIAHRCVSALPLAGRYRVIDVLLSNISESGIRNVGIIMQRNFQSLAAHIGSGDAWDLNKKNGGLALLTPFDWGMTTGLYQGFGDALFSKRYYLNGQREQYCLLLSSGIVYRENYNRLLDYHIEQDADITLLYSRNPRIGSGDYSNVCNLRVSNGGWVEGLDFGLSGDDDGCYSLGACVMNKDFMIRLVEDACISGRYDFVSGMLEPAISKYKVAALEHKGYASCLTTVKSYFDLSRDMLDYGICRELFIEQGPVYTRVADAPPIHFASGCEVENSLFGNGCDVRGRVVGSVVFRGVQIAAGADVENCIVMQDSRIGEGAFLRNAILDKHVIVEPGVRFIGSPDTPCIARKRTVIKGDKK